MSCCSVTATVPGQLYADKMKILVLNAHSAQNAGDLAILQEALFYLQSAFPNAVITVAINDLDLQKLPSEAVYVASFTRWLIKINSSGEWCWNKLLALPYACWLLCAGWTYRYLRLQLLPYKVEHRNLMLAYYDADLVVVIGGGHLYGLHPFNITFLWLWLGLALAIIMGKPLLFLPQSFGPIEGIVQRRLLRWLLEHGTFVSAREYRSLQILAEIGYRHRVVVLPDLAFTATEALPHIVNASLPGYISLCNGQSPTVGLTLMDWGKQNKRFTNQQGYEEAILTLITYVRDRYNAQIILFAQCTGPTDAHDDRRIARKIIASIEEREGLYFIDETLAPDILKAAYRKLDVLVATRMHSAIFALSVEVPTLVINYLHKSVGIMEMLGLAHHTLDINQIQADNLCQSFDCLWQERTAVREGLSKRIPAFQSTLLYLPDLLQ